MSDDHAVLHYRYEWGDGAQWWLLKDTLGLIPEYAEMLEKHHPITNHFCEDDSNACSFYEGCWSWGTCEVREELEERARELIAAVQPELAKLVLKAYLSLKETEG